MYSTRARRSFSEITLQDGMEVPVTPFVMVFKRSSSVGSEPLGVDRILNFPAVRSRGFG